MNKPRFDAVHAEETRLIKTSAGSIGDTISNATQESLPMQREAWKSVVVLWEQEPRAKIEGIDVLMLLMGSLVCMMACDARCARCCETARRSSLLCI